MPRSPEQIQQEIDAARESLAATLDQLVAPGCAWLDVGCGRHILPGNSALARSLAGRCEVLVGVDPDPTIDENPFVHRRVRSPIDQFHDERTFDVVTLRMVAEHITDPRATAAALRGRPAGSASAECAAFWRQVVTERLERGSDVDLQRRLLTTLESMHP